MKIVEAMPFAAELLTPTYEECFRREGAAPGAGEIALDRRWSIITAGEHELLTVAAEHLGNFVRRSVGGELGDTSVPHAIGCAVTGHRRRSRPSATHRRRGIEIIGAGPAVCCTGSSAREPDARARQADAAGREARAAVRAPHPSLATVAILCRGADRRARRPSMPSGSTRHGLRRLEHEDAAQMFYHDNCLCAWPSTASTARLRASFRHFARSVFPEFGHSTDLRRLRDLSQRAAATASASISR